MELGLFTSDCGSPLPLVLFCAVVVLPLADGLVLGEALALVCALSVLEPDGLLGLVVLLGILLDAVVLPPEL
jgi:hypothetical protein